MAAACTHRGRSSARERRQRCCRRRGQRDVQQQSRCCKATGTLCATCGRQGEPAEARAKRRHVQGARSGLAAAIERMPGTLDVMQTHLCALARRQRATAGRLNCRVAPCGSPLVLSAPRAQAAMHQGVLEQPCCPAVHAKLAAWLAKNRPIQALQHTSPTHRHSDQHLQATETCRRSLRARPRRGPLPGGSRPAPPAASTRMAAATREWVAGVLACATQTLSAP